MSMKEHYKRLLGEMAQTRARAEQMARDISDAQKHSDKTKAIRNKLFQDLQDIGADPDYDPNTHLDAAAETGLDLVAATDNHRDAFLNLVRLQRRNEMEQASRTLYDVDGQRVVTPRARRPEAAARSPRAFRRSRGNVREDVQTPERATQTTRNIRRLGREATALGKRSDAIYQGIYGIHPRDARDISSLFKMDFSKVMADPFGASYGDYPGSVDDYIDAKDAQIRASQKARGEQGHPTNIYGLGGKVVGTLASPGKPATGIGRGKTAKDFVGKKTAKKTAKKTSTAKKPVKSFKKRLEEALLSEMAQTAARGNETAVAAKRLQGFSTHSALPAEERAKHAAELKRLQRVIGQEQSSPKTYDLGGRIVGPGGRLGRRRANDPAQSGPISIASDSGRRAAAARMPFGM